MPVPAAHGRLSQLHVRIAPGLLGELKALAARRRLPVSQLVRGFIARELVDSDSASGSVPDESAIREIAILIAVELVLKLQEASMPGGTTLSRHLLEDAARSAIERLELVEAQLRRESES